MIDLRKHYQPLRDFVRNGVAGFRQEHPSSRAGHVGLYSCPWSGWVSLCVNHEAMSDPNCPDFDFVEFRLYDAGAWAREYENSYPVEIIDLDGERHVVDVENAGDEAFNQVFFGALRKVLEEVYREADTSFGVDSPRLTVQLLDSAYQTTW